MKLKSRLEGHPLACKVCGCEDFTNRYGWLSCSNCNKYGVHENLAVLVDGDEYSAIPEIFSGLPWQPVTENSQWNTGDVVVFLLYWGNENCKIVTLDCYRNDDREDNKYQWDFEGDFSDFFSEGDVYCWNPFTGFGPAHADPKAKFYVKVKEGDGR